MGLEPLSCEYMVHYPDGTNNTFIYENVAGNLYCQAGDTSNQLHIHAGIVGH